MNKNIVIWGIGTVTQDFLQKKYLYQDCKIVAFVDNDRKLWGGDSCFKGIPIVSPYELVSLAFDQIVVTSRFKEEIYSQLEDLKIPKEKITDVEKLEELVKKSIIDKYRDSDDPDIVSTIDYFKKNKLSIFGSYTPEQDQYELFWEDDNPYVMLEGKKLYYPKGFFPKAKSPNQLVYDVLYEQHENSPHLYVKDNHIVEKGDIVVDAGVSEGNFALRYIDLVKKIYLIECSPIWKEPLEKTFAPYRDKVVFCWKELGRSTNKKTISLDDLITEKIDFLKMDIEGAEVDALLGAKNVLAKSNAKCSICSYHKYSDEDNIKFILKSLGYDTCTSSGRMFFCYDSCIGDTLDLRHGIVYANKKTS